MDKAEVAAVLDEIGTLLEMQGENAFRSQAYHNAARAIDQLEESLEDVVAAGKLADLAGIGETLRDKITTLVTTGRLPFHEQLRAKTPPGLFDVLRIPGLGPKKVKALFEQLKIADLPQLKAACEDNQVAGLKGFGEKTQQKILEGIAFLGTAGKRVRVDQAEELAHIILAGMRNAPGIRRMEICGSLRRRKETIADIDLLISADDPEPLMERFSKLPGVRQVLGRGPSKCTILLVGDGHRRPVTVQADLRVVRDDQFPFALHYFTGSKEHNIAMRVRAQDQGLRLNEYGLTGPDGPLTCKDEAQLFKALGLEFIAPELREGTGEMEAASTNALPDLLELSDIQGVFHCHTNWSDGGNTLEEMAAAARGMGLHYLGIADHSQSLTVANGLNPQRVREQQKLIDQLNKRLNGFRVFKGIECDILADGRLDYDDDVLASFDYVVASVHSHFNQPREEMTARIVKAVSHPRVTMLGHATGRLLLKRDSYAVDLEPVVQAAAKHRTMVEINSNPMRLELDWVHCKRAKALGVQLVINPDAHSIDDLALYRYGVDVARRGWLDKADILNARSLAQVTAELVERRKRG
jgi:DNA polymerase (family 10)